MDKLSYKIFKNGSVTFFTASLFFPKKIQEDVFDLYAFVRVFDDFVDSVPQQTSEYYNLKTEYYDALNGLPANSSVVARFVKLQKRCQFEQSWIDSFFKSMEQDMSKLDYEDLSETLEYIYGSAEVIGLMMAKIMKLTPESFPYAQALGKTFQYMNMIRDIAEDQKFSRTYLPSIVFKKYGLENLSEREANLKPEQFKKFILSEIDRYWIWRKEAEQGFKFIPKRLRIPVEAAALMFDSTILKISVDPKLIFNSKVKPTKPEVIISLVKSIF
ncbi:MAG TPA: phytoene/squalene synthase family protein [Candidatus Doudnabacteria bacterium]|nr:phytoene/squalene synthase family protein [Candidatus Doudnabacteria bacterium]